MIRELWIFRRYVINNALGELKFRYAGSVAGVMWNVLNPLFQILVYTIVFSSIMVTKIPRLGTATGFAIYLCAGLLAWISFSESITRGTNAFLDNSTFLKKLPIPEHIFVAKTTMSAVLNAAISYVLLLGFMLVLGYHLYWTMLLVPLVLLLFMLFGYGLGLILGTINVFIRDVSQLVNIGIVIWMWLTPIVYVYQILPPTFREVATLNPAFQFVDALHNLLVYNTVVSLSEWGIMVVLATCTPLLGYFILSRLREEIRDVI